MCYNHHPFWQWHHLHHGCYVGVIVGIIWLYWLCSVLWLLLCCNFLTHWCYCDKVECNTSTYIKCSLIYGNIMGLILYNIYQCFESHQVQHVFIKAFLKWKAIWERQVEHKYNKKETWKTHANYRGKEKFCYVLGYHIRMLLCIIKIGTSSVFVWKSNHSIGSVFLWSATRGDIRVIWGSHSDINKYISCLECDVL